MMRRATCTVLPDAFCLVMLSACSLQAVNSLENTAPWTRHSIDANESLGVDPFVLSDYYLRPFKSAIRGADARGVMCSYVREHRSLGYAWL